MRRRLILQAAAVTSMVALAFAIPLAILIGDVAADRAMATAEREAENVARYMALNAPDLPTAAELDSFIPSTTSPFEISIVGPDGTVVGAPIPASEDLTSATNGTGSRARVDGGRAVYIPVIGADGATSVIRVFVPDSELSIGVARSWTTLGALSVALVLTAILIADWIGRTIVKPVAQLSETAARLGAGDLTARVEPDGPEEVKAAGQEFNRLAEQIDRLLLLEREAAADLSHRLRTPLTALRLDTEALAPGEARERLLDDLAVLERTVDFVIAQARRGSSAGLPAARTDFAATVRERVDFWSVLADDQGRQMVANLTPEPATVAIDREDASAMLDALLGNVFAHTPEGTPIGVTSLIRSGEIIVAIEDGGPGLPDLDVLERGKSHGASSGLGLDIARKTAQSAGGDLRVGTSRTYGGAVIAVTLPLTDG